MPHIREDLTSASPKIQKIQVEQTVTAHTCDPSVTWADRQILQAWDSHDFETLSQKIRFKKKEKEKKT